jgi:hypothetical protein
MPSLKHLSQYQAVLLDEAHTKRSRVSLWLGAIVCLSLSSLEEISMLGTASLDQTSGDPSR